MTEKERKWLAKIVSSETVNAKNLLTGDLNEKMKEVCSGIDDIGLKIDGMEKQIDEWNSIMEDPYDTVPI